MTHNELKCGALKRSEVWAAYEEAGPEFELLRQLMEARQEAGLTQAQVVARGQKANTTLLHRIEAICHSAGFESPTIRTPQQLMEG